MSIQNELVLCPFQKLICLGILALASITGCNPPSGAEGDAAGKSKLPKMKFHRPKTAALAAKRLRELHEALASEGELPKPIEFSMVEVIHGEGSGAHSHYYLESKWDPDAEDEHHGEMKETIKKHQIKVDPFTEFTDIVAWTPNIAAAAELSEEQWNEISQICEAMGKTLETGMKSGASNAEKREAYKKNATEFAGFIAKLESLVATTVSKK